MLTVSSNNVVSSFLFDIMLILTQYAEDTMLYTSNQDFKPACTELENAIKDWIQLYQGVPQILSL